MKSPLVIAIVCLVCFFAGTKFSRNKQDTATNLGDSGMADFRNIPAQSAQQPQGASNNKPAGPSQGKKTSIDHIGIRDIPDERNQQPSSNSRVMLEDSEPRRVSDMDPSRRSSPRPLPEQMPRENRRPEVRSAGVGQRSVNRGEIAFHKYKYCRKYHVVGECPLPRP